MDHEEISLQTKNDLEALEIYQKALVCHPLNAALHANISCILLRLNRIEEADKEADLAIQLRPQWPEAYIRKSEALLRQGRLSAALVHFCQSIRLDPKNNENIQLTKEKALEIYNEFPIDELRDLCLENDAFMIVATIGIMMAIQGQTSESIQVLTNCQKMEDKQPKMFETVLGYLGISHFKQKNYRKSISYYEQQLEIAEQLNVPHVQDIRKNISLAAEASSDIHLAILQRKHRIDSSTLSEDDLVAEMIQLSELLILDGQPELALNQLKTIKEMKIGSIITKFKKHIHVLEGSAYVVQGKTAECLSLLEKYQSNDSEIMIRCMESVHLCFLREGRIEDSIQYLMAILRKASESANERLNLKASLLLCKSYASLGQSSKVFALARSIRSCTDANSKEMNELYKILVEMYESKRDWNDAVMILKKMLDNLNKGTREYVNCCLEISRILEKLPKKQKQRKHYLTMAVTAADLSADVSSRILSRSAMIRFLIRQGLLKEIIPLIDGYKEFLDFDISNMHRSIIVSDLVKMNNNQIYTIDLTQDEQNPLEQLIVTMELGDAELGRENYEMSEELYKKSLDIATKHRVGMGIQKNLLKLASLYAITLDWENGLCTAEQALLLAHSTNNYEMISELLCLKSQILLEKNEISNAMRLARKATKIAEKKYLIEERIRCYEILVKIYKIVEREDEILKYQNKLECALLDRLD